MAILPLLPYGSPLLRRRSLPVSTLDGTLQQVIDDMIATMYAAPGVGLAAPQVGHLLRVIVVNPSESQDPAQLLTLLNPEIIEADGEMRAEEGCLSLPQIRDEVTRSRRALLRATDRTGKPLEIEGTGLLARIFQHEVDHLNGIFFIDHLSTAKKDVLRRRLKKAATPPSP